MSFYNGILNHDDNHESGQIGSRGLPGIGFKVDADGNFDIENKKLTNVKNGDMDHDVMVKSQIERYVNNKTKYLDGVLPAQVTKNKAVIYSLSGGIHTNDLYLKDQYGQEVHVHTEDQDLNQCRLHVPNLKNNDSYGGRRKSIVVVTSIDQTIEGKKIFNNIHVNNPTLDTQASNKKYVDTNFVAKSGDTMLGPLVVQKDDYPVQGNLNKVISYQAQREIFLSKKEGGKMEQAIDMNGFSIDNLPLPTDPDHACNKNYIDNNFLNRLTGGQIGEDLDMRGHSIKYLKFDKSDSAAARVAELNSKADKSDLDDYFKLDGTKAMTGNLQMNNHRIYKLPTPQLADEPATLGYVLQLNNNLFNSYLDLAGVRKMTGNLQMNNNYITGLTNPPSADDHASNKKYVDDTISKANIKPSHTPKNAFKYLMEDVNEWSSEYNIKVGNFSDITEIPHSWNKQVLNITPIKDGANYRFRLGLQMFPLTTNQSYSLIVELYNRDYKTWLRQQTYIEGTGIWLKSHNTTKFQHRYGSKRDLYYRKTLVKFKKTSDRAPIFVYYTVHFDDNGGDMNTYPKDFKNQVYIVAYGIAGETDHVESEVYDAHKAYEIDKTKMKMLVPLDMKNKAITNIPNLSNGGLISLYGKVGSDKYFRASDIQLAFRNVYIVYINIHGSQKLRSTQDILNIEVLNLTKIKYQFTYPSLVAHVHIQINKFFEGINNIQFSNSSDVAFQLAYKLFY